LLAQADADSERTEIFLNCWTVVCSSNSSQVPNQVAGRYSSDLKAGKTAGFHPVLIEFLHPVLMALSRALFEVVCDGFLKFPYAESDFEDYVRVAVSVFIVFASKFGYNQTTMRCIAELLLQWLPKIQHQALDSLTFCIDALNYVFAQTATFAAAEPDRWQELLQSFHEELKHPLNSLPVGLRNYIIPNQPPAFFAPPSDPMFTGYAAPPQGPGDDAREGATYEPPDGMMEDWEW
jgi:hypothetical protein